VAGDWIKLRVDLFEDPSTLGIASRLKMDVEAVVGKLTRIWAWAGSHTANGVIRRISADTIDRIASAPGFASAMTEVGWLEVEKDKICFPNWDRHNGQGAKARLLAARRASRARNGESVTPSDATAETAESRAKNRSEESSTAEQRVVEQRTDAESVPAELSQAQWEICSALLQVRMGDEKLFSAPDAYAIAQHPKACRRQFMWALERFRHQVRRGGTIKNPAGYLRDLIERKQPPRGWVEKYQKETLAAAIKRESIELNAKRARGAAPGLRSAESEGPYEEE
jgi:hypothetical protein